MAKKVKFNLMDCLIVLTVVAVIAGGLFVLSNLKGGSSTAGAKEITLRYTVELAKEDQAIMEQFVSAAERGDKCFVGEKERAEAVIKEVTYTPAKELTTNTRTGEAVWAEVPDKYCVNVTLESKGSDTDTEVVAGGGAMIKVGAETSVKGKGYAGYGFITALEIVGE